MLKTIDASVNGYAVEQYSAGTQHDMGKSDKHKELAEIFLKEKWAELVVKKQPLPQVNKVNRNIKP
jgi:hypothetical protein